MSSLSRRTGSDISMEGTSVHVGTDGLTHSGLANHADNINNNNNNNIKDELEAKPASKRNLAESDNDIIESDDEDDGTYPGINASAATAVTYRDSVGKIAKPKLTHNAPNNNATNNSTTTPTDEVQSIFVYIPNGALPKLNRYVNQVIEVRIPSKYLTSKNRDVLSRQLWGGIDDTYTDDSDPVAVLQHSGNMILRPNPPSISLGLRLFFRVLSPLSNYESITRYNYRSRAWKPEYHRNSIKILRVEHINDPQQLLPTQESNQQAATKAAQAKKAITNSKLEAKTKEFTKEKIVPMLVLQNPAVRPTKALGKSKRKFMPECTIIYNQFNEPVLKYFLGLIGDRGMEETEWTSNRLRKEAIYLEYYAEKYELVRETSNDFPHASSAENKQYDRYRFSAVLPLDSIEEKFQTALAQSLNSPAPTAAPTTGKGRGRSSSSAATLQNAQAAHQQQQLQQLHNLAASLLPSSVPLRGDQVRVIETGVDWEQIEWGPSSVRIKGKEYFIQTIQFKPYTNITATNTSQQAMHM
jgi:hypothetical protein